MIQIGAFASRRGANDFARMSENKLSEKIVVDFSDKVDLYTVQLKRKFDNRYDAERLRDKLRQQEEFKDAWVVELKK
ncbi:sporulation related domain protein [bacterium BMS3Abin03]|nr:sporulation related domain protein [bacterium BMS3Abin03]